MRKSILILTIAVAATLSAAAIDQKDVEYTRPDGKPVLLDLHIPDGPGPFPAAILIHGGGFDQGSKSTNVRPLFEPLANAGYAWFSIDYRMAPEFRFPQAIEDVNSAIKWVKANAAEVPRRRGENRADRRIGRRIPGELRRHARDAGDQGPRSGGSVRPSGLRQAGRGAARSPGTLQHDQHQPPRRQRRWHPLLRRGATRHRGPHEVEGHLADLRRSQGNATLPCIHGTKDDQVSYDQSPAMCKAMKAKGASCELIPIEGGGHGMSGWKAPEMQHWKPEMLAWLKKTMQ